MAVARGNSILGEAHETGGRGTNAFGLIERVLAETTIEREEVVAIAVGLGPGSYTGIRAAISIAQGWQLARGIKLIGISSVEAIVAQAHAEKIFGSVSVVIDAQRNEFYLATFKISTGERREIEPLKIVSAAEIQQRPNANEILVGPEIEKWFAAGQTIFPAARMTARLAAGKTELGEEILEPIYLRETNFVKASAPGKSV
ncbi:MAG TPA: tRNA (adenosine(37)-N6)-threonylcarbamoyltransferase complex dimerization subunit type 1 TsaB [Verrucomicrobiae bacterium]|nr:tRNA (adenosine(37)-N6)-threonylcarbamoyltransferase complex dimerization subunit type 1 TsaB [Verrucomicrobiae bacterium]